MQELMTARELASFLKVSPSTAKRLMRAGALPTVRISAVSIRVTREDAEAFVESRKIGGRHGKRGGMDFLLRNGRRGGMERGTGDSGIPV